MRSQRSLKLKTIFAAGSLLACGSAIAQGTTLTLTDLGLSEAQTRALLNILNAPAATPALSFGSPVAFGADWGEIGVGVGGQTLQNNNVNPANVDGSMAAVIGFGDADKYVGFEASVNVISLRKSFGDDGAFGAKLHTTLPGRAAFAVGVSDIGRWGAAKGGKSSVYAVGSKFFNLGPNVPLAVNVGIGDNVFNKVSFHATGGLDPNGNPNGFDEVETGANVFGGVAIYPIQQLSLIADWTGRGLNLGISAAPFRSVALVGTLGALNVTGEYQGRQFGSDTEFGAGLGYNFSF
jgi:hypothetical protein